MIGGAGCAPIDDTGQIAEDLTVTGVQQVTPTESRVPPHSVNQFQPTTTFFGANGTQTPVWVTCYNDDTHRGDAQPNASGITCTTQKSDGVVQQMLTITGQAPFATGNAYPFSDAWVTRDPANPNQVFLVALMLWNSATSGDRESVGVARLVFDPAAPLSSAMSLHEPNPGCCGDAMRMVPIAGDGVEGAFFNDVTPDRPVIAIDPTADSKGNHNQYIAFFQNDATKTPQRGRIAVIRRDDTSARFWSTPITVHATGVATDSDGFSPDTNNFQFEAPQLAVHPTDHSIGIAFIHIQAELNTGLNPAIDNAPFINKPLDCFFARSTNSFTTDATAISIAAAAHTTFLAGSMAPGSIASGELFTYFPYPQLIWETSHSRWSMMVSTEVVDNMGFGARGWDVFVTASTDVSGTAWSSLFGVPLTPSNITLSSPNYRNAVQPTMTFDPISGQTFAAAIVAADDNENTFAPAFNVSTSSIGWGPAALVTTASSPRPVHPGQATWGGFWGTGGGGGLPGQTREGDFGDYTGSGGTAGQFLFTWNDSRSSSPGIDATDVFSAHLQ